MLFKTTKIYEEAEWEEIWEKIPDEELWEDGELSNVEVQQKILNHTMQKGDWLLIRRVEE